MSSVDTVVPPLTPTPNASGIARNTPIGAVPPPISAPTFYVMRGTDKNVNGLEDVWSSPTVDMTGANYPSSISRGSPLTTPLRNIRIAVPPKL